jgi:malate dehydrogenase (oxaloacetate-decarboxylating)(NADP+)
LEEAIKASDVFIGVSKANLLNPDLLKLMAPKPIIFALANPDPEILPKLAHSIRKDLIIATGRSDFPNQVNNVLCFPYIFRGALDVMATKINKEMMLAAVYAIKALAKEPVSKEVIKAYDGITKLEFGVDYILPKPIDPRLLSKVSTAVANAAINSGIVAKNN